MIKLCPEIHTEKTKDKYFDSMIRQRILIQISHISLPIPSWETDRAQILGILNPSNFNEKLLC